MLHELKGLNMTKIVNCTECLKNKLYKIYTKTLAFTLAETLIVMGVIGVVAALTLPNLNSSTGNKEKVAKLQKIYSNLNDAFGRATAVYGPLEEWPQGNDQNYRGAERIVEFMKLSKSCGLTNMSSCFKYPGTNNDMPTYITADGTALSFYIHPDCNSANYTQCGSILVDIDGPNKGKMKVCQDYFAFAVRKDGIYPKGSQQDPKSNTDTLVQNALKKSYLGTDIDHICTGWIIETGNMDYLKLDSNGKCPDGSYLNWSHTSCK